MLKTPPSQSAKTLAKSLKNYEKALNVILIYFFSKFVNDHKENPIIKFKNHEID